MLATCFTPALLPSFIAFCWILFKIDRFSPPPLLPSSPRPAPSFPWRISGLLTHLLPSLLPPTSHPPPAICSPSSSQSQPLAMKVPPPSASAPRLLRGPSFQRPRPERRAAWGTLRDGAAACSPLRVGRSFSPAEHPACRLTPPMSLFQNHTLACTDQPTNTNGPSNVPSTSLCPWLVSLPHLVTLCRPTQCSEDGVMCLFLCLL